MKFTLVSAAAVALAAQQVLAGGPIKGCLQTHTVVAGDSCDGIAASFKLTPDEFYAMNPGLHHAGDHLCDNLDDGKPYCVCTKKPCAPEPAGGNSTASASGSAPASSGSAAASGSASGSPSGSAAASGASSASVSPIAASSSAASSSGASSGSSGSSSGSAAAASESKTNTAVSSAPTKTALALSVVAIAAVVLL